MHIHRKFTGKVGGFIHFIHEAPVSQVFPMQVQERHSRDRLGEQSDRNLLLDWCLESEVIK